MERLLKALGAAAVAGLMAGCTPAVNTSIENYTGQNVSLRYVISGREQTFGPLKSGSDYGLGLPEQVWKLQSLVYSYGGQSCRLNREQILDRAVERSDPTLLGPRVTVVVRLTPC